MQYMLMIHVDETAMANVPPEMAEQMLAPYAAYNEALAKAGILMSAERLQPSAATTVVRVRDGKSEVLDGPYADSKEQIGGFYVIEASDLDDAIAWAARCPGASHGTIEVRPVWGARL